MKNTEITEYLDELYPDAHCEINYTNLYELLIAVILSAQTTDKKVNSVTPLLFNKYPSFNELEKANINDVVDIVRILGLANNKAKNIISCASTINNIYNGNIPQTKEELLTLPGVGEKVACVFLAEGLHQNEFPVDTHVLRVSNRLKISKSKNPLIVEKDLRKYFKGFDFHKLHHQFIFFGRYTCKAIKPECENCKFNGFCKK